MKRFRDGITAAAAVLLAVCGLQTLDPVLSAAPRAAGPETPSVPMSTTRTDGSWQVTITDLGLLPGGIYASAYAINNTGKIVGMAYDAVGALTTVQWVNGQISPISGLGASAASVPEDIDDAGEIAGTLRISNREYMGIYWNALNNPFQLPAIPGGTPILVRAHAINASGQIAGLGQEGSPNYWGHAAVWLGNSFQTDLGFMGGGHYSEAYGINDLGDVVGVAEVASTAQHAFLWREGQYTDLSSWGGGASSIAYAINNHGEIVGLNGGVASLWKDGTVQALPVPPGVSVYTPAIDINDAGDIIATGSKGYPFDVGVLWRNGAPIDLGTLPGGTISRARRLNARGEVVGEANASSGGSFHAVKWVVTPLSSSVDHAVQQAPGDRPQPNAVRITPSPFTTVTTLHVTLERAGAATVNVFDSAGRRVRQIAAGWLPRGEQAFTWDGRNDAGAAVPGGVYYVQVNGGTQTAGCAVVRISG